MKAYRLLSIAWVVTTMPCGSDIVGPDNRCDTVSLPLTGPADGPVIVDVTLEVQSTGVIVLATATDPQGSGNLLGVMQTVSVFPDTTCTGTPIVIEDDLAESGVEESFGTIVAADQQPTLYSAIAAAASWPVALDFRDGDGNRTRGRIMAAVTN